MFQLYINGTDHGTFELVSDALDYIRCEIEDGELENVTADSLEIQIVK